METVWSIYLIVKSDWGASARKLQRQGLELVLLWPDFGRPCKKISRLKTSAAAAREEEEDREEGPKAEE